MPSCKLCPKSMLGSTTIPTPASRYMARICECERWPRNCTTSFRPRFRTWASSFGRKSALAGDEQLAFDPAFAQQRHGLDEVLVAFDRNQVCRAEDRVSRSGGRGKFSFRGQVDAQVQHHGIAGIGLCAQRYGHPPPAQGNEADKTRLSQLFRQQVVQVDIGAVCRTTPRRFRNDAGDHGHRGGSGDPVDVDVIGLPSSRQSAQPKPLGIDGQILGEGGPSAVAEQGGQGAESAAGPQEDLPDGAFQDVPAEQWSCRAVGLELGSVLVYELLGRRAGHDPHVVSPPPQFLDFGNQEGFAYAIRQGGCHVENLRRPGSAGRASCDSGSIDACPFADNPSPTTLQFPHMSYRNRP